MRPGIGETLIILDTPREVRTFEFGVSLLAHACLRGQEGFDEHFHNQFTDYKDNNVLKYPDYQLEDEVIVDVDNYETARFALESIAYLRYHHDWKVIAKRMFRKYTAQKILNELDEQKYQYDMERNFQ